jgi:hypothetical protein
MRRGGDVTAARDPIDLLIWIRASGRRRHGQFPACTAAIDGSAAHFHHLSAIGCHLVSVGGCCRPRATMESGMSKPGLDNRHRNKDGEISHKHGNTLIQTLRKIYGQNFAAGYPGTEKLSDVLLKLNETSLSQLRRDHETGHLEHKLANASK